jgi:hypothetical protein
MIIASALSRLFEGLEVDLTIDNQTFKRGVRYHYGDNKELAAWITANKSSQKYPLVWYVIAPHYDQENGYKTVKTNLIILQNTQPTWLNTKRSVKSYDEIIEPTWQKVKKTLESNPFISVLGAKPERYRIMDEPNYGVNASSITDFTNKQTKGDQSITLDIVDGRIIELNLRIKTNCIS